MFATAYNSTDTAQVVDVEGRTIDAHGFGTVDTTDDATKALAEAGVLHIFPDLEAGPGQSEAAEAAIATTTEVRARQDRFEALDKDELIGLAGKAGVSTPNDLHKPDLVTALALRTSFDDESALEELRAEAKAAKKPKQARSTASAGSTPQPEKPEEA